MPWRARITMLLIMFGGLALIVTSALRATAVPNPGFKRRDEQLRDLNRIAREE